DLSRRVLAGCPALLMASLLPGCASGAGPTVATLVWSDEVEPIDAGSGRFAIGGGGWGNPVHDDYTVRGRVFRQDAPLAGSRVLVIEARRGAPAAAACWYGACQYSSSRMVTRGRREFRHGRIEARMRLPQTQGIWPAFWMLGGNF